MDATHAHGAPPTSVKDTVEVIGALTMDVRTAPGVVAIYVHLVGVVDAELTMLV